MHVAYIDPRPVPGDTVEALQIAQNVDAFARSGGRISLVTPEPGAAPDAQALLGRPWHPALEIACLPDYRKRFRLLARSNRPFIYSARRWVARHRPDALWVRHLRLARALAADRAMPPLFFETHELFARALEESQPGAKRKLARLRTLEHAVYAASRGLICLTRGLVHDVVADYGVAVPTLVAPDGFDALLAAQAKPARPTAEPMILYLGSLHPWKGVDVLVRAMKHVGVGRLVIAGGHLAAIEPLRELAAAEGVAARIDFLGAVPPNRRFDWIAAADLCVLPLSTSRIASRYTSPLKLFEYLASGKPVVTTDLPSVREVVQHGVDAWLVAHPDPILYSQAINRLLGDAELRAALGTAARSTAACYTWDTRARSIAAFMTEQLAHPRTVA